MATGWHDQARLWATEHSLPRVPGAAMCNAGHKARCYIIHENGSAQESGST